MFMIIIILMSVPVGGIPYYLESDVVSSVIGLLLDSKNRKSNLQVEKLLTEIKSSLCDYTAILLDTLMIRWGTASRCST